MQNTPKELNTVKHNKYADHIIKKFPLFENKCVTGIRVAQRTHVKLAIIL